MTATARVLTFDATRRPAARPDRLVEMIRTLDPIEREIVSLVVEELCRRRGEEQSS